VMKIKDIYDMAIAEGKKKDPRGIKGVSGEINRLKSDYNELSSEEKKSFDSERFFNPYADTRLLFGDTSKEVKVVMLGIDVDVGEVLLADKLKEKGQRIDLLMSHHPSGKALANLHNVMMMQSDITNIMGVPINVAEALMEKRIKQVERRVHPSNHMRAVDAARLLEIPFMCVHTPADNHVVWYLQNLFDKKKPETLKGVLSILKNIPEYRQAEQNNAGPKIYVGNPKKRAGRVFVDMTGGTEGSREIIEKLQQAGVGTLVGMHFSEDHVKEAEKHNINMVVAGHISSDNIGLNLLLDSLQKKSKFRVIACSGFYRHERK